MNKKTAQATHTQIPLTGWRKELRKVKAAREAWYRDTHPRVVAILGSDAPQDTLRAILDVLYLFRIWESSDIPYDSMGDVARTVTNQQKKRSDIAVALRGFSEKLTDSYAQACITLARNIESDVFALKEAELITTLPRMDMGLVAKRGGSKRGGGPNKDGINRGWYVKVLDQCVPADTPRRYAVISRLLEIASITATSNYVRSILIEAGRHFRN